ncbi:undecaprenyl-diphosphate phosphatase [Proteus hauseri]|uniref:undecaprenyl-diphosphate phosphatase n=1 Tax=Proteus hauseri TaxID=183417 RepID=UPI0032DA55C8
MLEQLNLAVFSIINATPASSPLEVNLAIIIAKYLVYLFPLSLLFYWLWGSEKHLKQQRALVCKTAISLAIALTISWLIGVIAPHDRPFVANIGYNFLDHNPTPSFPSNHGTFVFTIALAYLFWHQSKRIGCILLGLSIAIAWSRIYLGVHWPIDMVGGFIVGLLSCGLSQIFWSKGGEKLQQWVQKLYQLCFAYPIRKGWTKA